MKNFMRCGQNQQPASANVFPAFVFFLLTRQVTGGNMFRIHRLQDQEHLNTIYLIHSLTNEYIVQFWLTITLLGCNSSKLNMVHLISVHTCIGRVPSPTNLLGCFFIVLARSSFNMRHKSKVSSGLAWRTV